MNDNHLQEFNKITPIQSVKFFYMHFKSHVTTNRFFVEQIYSFCSYDAVLCLYLT